MEVLHEPAALRAVCDAARRAGERVGVVPTMGALHAGHLALVDEARRRGATRVVVTVFVNPLQFGPSEDFTRYPRTLPDDVAACEARGVDWVFAPDRDAMYPAGFASQVRVVGLTDVLEGVFRPGHFDGVTTVVAKLFGLVGDSVAVFGRKDYQQWCVLRRMVRDLDMPIEMHGMKTVREADGLALSSRNRYLSPAERERALAISRGLRAACAALEAGERDPRVLEQLARAPIEASFDRIDYVAIADADSLAPIAQVEGRAVLAVAAKIGATRLIDNVVLGEERL
jgi:pantoate--beta-alanine ligase